MPTATINGFQHFYEDQGTGETLVLLHGATGSAHQFEEHIPSLSQHYRVIAPDMRSMGRSSHVKELTPVSAWVEDVGGLLDHLGVQQAHIMGSSLGSRVSMRFALEHPERVASLTVDAPIVAISTGANKNLNQRTGNPDDAPAAQKETYKRQHGDDWREVVLNYFSIRNNPALQEYFNLRDLIPQIQAPMLVLHGDAEDVTHPLADAYELKERVPNARLAIVPGLAYSVNRFGHERFPELVLEFLGSL
jgi:pimeloyl-ACP methyl ester carboxylesterase